MSAIFVTIATVKSKITVRILQLGYWGIFVKSNFQLLAPEGAKFAP